MWSSSFQNQMYPLFSKQMRLQQQVLFVILIGESILHFSTNMICAARGKGQGEPAG